MAKLIKHSDYTCPCCGGSENIETTDWDQNDEFLIHKMWCSDCAIAWREYFKIEYDGYTYDNKEFDKEGNEVK